jgi:hypothetical protein
MTVEYEVIVNLMRLTVADSCTHFEQGHCGDCVAAELVKRQQVISKAYAEELERLEKAVETYREAAYRGALNDV